MIFGSPLRRPLHPSNWQRPPAGQPGNLDFRLTQDLGPTSLAVEPTVAWPGGEDIPAGTYPHFHRGDDFGNGRSGDVVQAAKDGKVTFAGISSSGSITVVLDHGSGWLTYYGHLRDETTTVGATVKRGDPIGHVGSTGLSSGAHLHFGVKHTTTTRTGNAAWVDPWRRLIQNVGVHPKDDGINIRATPGSGSTPGAIVARTKGGLIIRESDKVSLGPWSTWRGTDWSVIGSTYEVAGIGGNLWTPIWLDGAWRWIAAPLVLANQT